MPKKYPLEFKKQAIRRYEKGEPIPALCQELHISQSTFYHWRNQYRSIQTSAHAYTPAEFDALVRRLQKAEHKLSIIQLSGYLSKVPLQDKLATLEHFYNEMSDLYSVHELCEALDVSRGTFYNHIFRRADRSKYESEKAQLISPEMVSAKSNPRSPTTSSRTRCSISMSRSRCPVMNWCAMHGRRCWKWCDP